MILLDEIRGRLAEVFSLKSYKIDHVVHGAIASAAVYGAMVGASPPEIEHAIGMTVAHYIPWRAIRAGKQLSDSKGASAAISTEAAILSVHRAMNGFIGPKDIFRNPEAIFRFFEPTKSHDESPFDLHLENKGNDFAVMGMHFKLGLYEHQSASAIDGLINLLSKEGKNILQDPKNIKSLKVLAYEPAFGIIGDPAKKNPTTRQSADHSMVYIISTMLRKAFEKKEIFESQEQSIEEYWKHLMLIPNDYSRDAIFNETTRQLMQKVTFEHGGPEYDEKYPEGIPTSLVIETTDGKTLDSGLIMFPGGHSRNKSVYLREVLQHKFKMLGRIALEKQDLINYVVNLENIGSMTNEDLRNIYECNIKYAEEPLDQA